MFLEPASSAYFLSDFPLVPPLKNFKKWPILVSLQNWSLLGIVGTFRAAVCGTMLSDDCTLSAGGVRPMIAKHAGRYRETAHSYQHRCRVHIKLL